MHKDIQSGLVLAAVAALYLWGLRGISETTLSDEVGPTGIPYLLGFALAVTGLLIAGRGVLLARKARSAAVPAAAAPAAPQEDDDEPDAPLWRGAGLLGLGVAFIGLAWLAGYIVAGAALLAAVAVFEGVRPSPRLAALAVLGAIGFWLLFVKLLGVSLPTSVLLGG